MKSYLLIIFTITVLNGFSQNIKELIPNSNFQKKGQVEWFSVKNMREDGLPILQDDRRPLFYQKSWCRSCKFNEDDNSNFISIIVANQIDSTYSQNISTKLKNRLIPSISYKLEINYTNSLLYKEKDKQITTELGSCYTKYIQVLLTVEKPKLKEGGWDYNKGKILIIPISTYKFNWSTDSIIFIADKEYNYLTIGNFGQNPIIKGKYPTDADGYKIGIQPHASYLIDYINLTEIPCEKGKIEFDDNKKPIYINCRHIKVQDSIELINTKNDISFHISDAGQADGDIISIYLNDKRKIIEYQLTNNPKGVNIKVNRDEKLYLIFDADGTGNVGDVKFKVNFTDSKNPNEELVYQIDNNKSNAILVKFMEGIVNEKKAQSSKETVIIEENFKINNESSFVIKKRLKHIIFHENTTTLTPESKNDLAILMNSASPPKQLIIHYDKNNCDESCNQLMTDRIVAIKMYLNELKVTLSMDYKKGKAEPKYTVE